MAKKTHDLAVKVGTYTDNNGNEKGKYKNVGIVIEKDDGGSFMMIDPTFNFAGVDRNGHDMVLVSKFEVKKKDNDNVSPENIDWD